MSNTFDMLLEDIRDSGRTYDFDKVNKAYNMAKLAHGDQRRASGELYIIHPIAVARILVDLGMDTDSICAALLHDVAEDTAVSIEEIQKEFGPEISELVDGVTKLGKIPLSTKEEQQAENVRKMLLAMSKDIRVIIIKLSDRLHNMRTLEFLPEQKQRDKALETMEVYAPIANRLGMRGVKEELEDTALKYLDPVAYNEINETLAQKNSQREDYIDFIKRRIKNRLDEYEIHPFIEGRVKSIYGIYRKVYINGRDFEEVYDIFAVRIIVSTVIECYNILGIIHDIFRPIPHRFKDYISTPKPNMYQSLHTTVVGKEAVPFEIQIRTWDMHYTAEYGIAAHWKYKEGIQGKDKLESRLAWIRKIIEAQQESDMAEDLVRTIKTDIGSEEVYVFTPKGDVKSLPEGSTVIDFAYAIHSEVGNRMIGAKIDGRIVPIDTQVKTGQIIDVITTNSQNHGPSRSWLKIVKTSEARSKIRSWFKREKRDENIAEGRAEIEREFRRNNIDLPDKEMQSFIEEVARKQHYDSIVDFLAAIGYGGISLSKIMPRVKDMYLKQVKVEEEEVDLSTVIQSRPKNDSGVIVEGIDNCLVKFAQCCNPLPGDEIIGFITRGHGVSVHKKDCTNVISSMKDPTQIDRWINVYWDSSNVTHYRCTLNILANNRESFLADVSLALTGFRVPIYELNARTLKNGNIEVTTTIEIGGMEQLKNLMQRVSKINGVMSVERAGK